MCGLAGVMARNLDVTQIKKFTDIYTVAQLRGDTGAGVVTVPFMANGAPVKHVPIRRTVWSSGHLVTTSDFYDAVKKNTNIIVGHARAPTRGGTDIKNVHPHRSGDIILVHNGTMNNVDGKTVAATQKHTDSAMIAECIAEKGPHHFVENSSGAYALVWIDLRKQTLNFLRNGERTLYLGYGKDSIINGRITEVWWASESMMMMWPLSRYTGYAKDKLEIKALPINEWWSWPLDVAHNIVEPTVVTCEKKYTAAAYVGWSAYGGYDDYDYDEYRPGSSHTHRSTGSSSVSSSTRSGGAGSTLPSSSVKSVTSGTFSYTPPGEREAKEKEGVSFMSVPEILNKARAEAARATGRAKAEELTSGMEDNQKKTKYLLEYACHSDDEAKQRMSAGGCVWCGETPTEVIEGIAPTIFPIKHTENRLEYVCSSCITDEDVQVFVGIRKEA